MAMVQGQNLVLDDGRFGIWCRRRTHRVDSAGIEGLKVDASDSDPGGVGGKDVVFLFICEALSPIIAF